MKKTIAIVGATESKGVEIANQFAGGDYRLLLISNDVAGLSRLSESIIVGNPGSEIDTIECVKDGCWEADVIILAVSYSEEKLVAELMREVATQKIVVSISGERNPDEELQLVLPYSSLVKVSFASHSKEIVISGNDKEADEEIAEIFSQAGYHTTIENHSLQSN